MTRNTTPTLKPYQERSREFLALRRTALLADEPRVGKTAPSIRACDDVGAKLVIVVTPAHVKQNWQREIAAWRKGQWSAIVVGYNRAKELLVRLNKRRCDVLIVDESHYAKQYDSGRSIAIWGKNSDGEGGLAGLADRVWCLTGTPQPNHPGELWPMLRALAPDLIMRPNGRPLPRSAFEDKYTSRIQTPFGMKIVGSKNAKELRERMAGFVLRRTRKEVFGRDLQAPTVHFVGASLANRRAIDAFENSDVGRRIKTALANGGPAALKKQAEGAQEYRRLVGLAKVSELAQLLSDELDNEPGRKVVVAAYHTAVIDAYRTALKKYNPLVLDGRVDQSRKQPTADKFQRDPKHRVFIGQIDAAGTGIDLSAADDMVFAESSWVHTSNEQMMARVFNLNKSSPCFVRYAVLAGSIDEDIGRACARKERDAKKVLGQ